VVGDADGWSRDPSPQRKHWRIEAHQLSNERVLVASCELMQASKRSAPTSRRPAQATGSEASNIRKDKAMKESSMEARSLDQTLDDKALDTLFRSASHTKWQPAGEMSCCMSSTIC